MALVNSGPWSFMEIIIVERKTTGNTEKIPLRIIPMLERLTARAMTMPAMIPRKAILRGVK